MSNLRELKVICYAAHLIVLNEYLATFPGEKAKEKLVNQNGMKFCRKACQIAVSGKRIFRFLIVNTLLKKNL